jgi:hypothetical protein
MLGEFRSGKVTLLQAVRLSQVSSGYARIGLVI